MYTVRVSRVDGPNRCTGGRDFRTAMGEDWIVAPNDDPVALAAAWRQYRLARQVWAQVDRRVTTVSALAEAVGQSYETQRRKLMGQEPASGRDLALWQLVGDPAADPDGVVKGVFPPGTERLLAGWELGAGCLPRLVAPEREITDVDWGAVADKLAQRLSEADDLGLLELVSADALRYELSRSLVEAGVEAAALALRDRALLGGVAGETLMAASMAFGTGPRQHAASQALLGSVSSVLAELATTEAGTRIVVLCFDARGRRVLAPLLPPSFLATTGPELATIGPVEPALGAEEVWSVSSTSGRRVALATTDAVSVIVLEISKLNEL